MYFFYLKHLFLENNDCTSNKVLKRKKFKALFFSTTCCNIK